MEQTEIAYLDPKNVKPFFIFPFCRSRMAFRTALTNIMPPCGALVFVLVPRSFFNGAPISVTLPTTHLCRTAPQYSTVVPQSRLYRFFGALVPDVLTESAVTGSLMS